MQVIKLSLLLGAALAAPLNGHRALRGSAAYFLDNNPEGSSIISLHVDNGLLSDPFRTSTGGQGSIGTNTTGFPNAVDSLMSQGSVAVGGGVCTILVMMSIEADNAVVPFHGQRWL